MLNASAQSVAGLRRSDHITKTLASLHWLCASERIQFKLAMLIFRSLHGLAPQYLADDLIRVADMPSRHRLRSARTHRRSYPECGLQLSATEHSVRPVPDSGTACPVTSSIVRLSRWLKHFFFNVFLFILALFFCVYFILLWTLKSFYLGHVKRTLCNTIFCTV